jgi:hypothetical protein
LSPGLRVAASGLRLPAAIHRAVRRKMDCFVAVAPRNDGGGFGYRYAIRALG